MPNVESEVGRIDWSLYSTAYGNAETVPRLLKLLGSSDLKVAMKASHDLWCSLCHQHAYISSAALPSYPTLLRVLRSSTEILAVEILDILWGFSKCSSKEFLEPQQQQKWMIELRNQMKCDEFYFLELAKSKNEDIHFFATSVLEELNKD